MAAIHIYTRFSDAPHSDELCPKCHNPALKEYILQRVGIAGITPIGTRVACADCGVWVTSLKELP